MGLDLVAVSREIEELGPALRRAGEERRAKLSKARELIDDVPLERWQALSDARDGARTLPRPIESLSTSMAPRAVSAAFTVTGVDGSQIASDRHSLLPCHVINIGTASLRYGADSDATLESRAHIAFRAEDRFIVDPANPERRTPIAGAVLHARRTVLETERLAELAEAFPAGETGLLLLDNALVFWGLAAGLFRDYVGERLLEDYRGNLERVQRANQGGRVVPLAGYVSRPDSSAVVGLLARDLCREPDCRDECDKLGHGRRPCDGVSGLLDREIFGPLLATPGHRSALFASSLNVAGKASSSGNGLGAAHEPWFFYLNAGAEIARVEVPAWVAADPARLELVHNLVADQVRRGEGYPVALMEANEQAFVGKSDRDQFWYLIEVALAEAGFDSGLSAKGWSKRWRAV